MSSLDPELSVADCHVTDFRLVSIRAEAQGYDAPYESVRVQFELGDFRVKGIEDGMRFRATADAVLHADGLDDVVLAEISLLYEVDLQAPDERTQAVIESDGLRRKIIDSRVMPYLFPFVRQKIHELTTELPLPPVLLPADAFGNDGLRQQ